jgi:hypothetical protein
MRIALLVVAGIALVGFMIVAVVLPHQHDAAARDAALALIAGAEQAKQQVSASAAKTGQLTGAGLDVKVAPRNDPKFGEMKWVVTENGDIRGWNDRNALEVTMTPTIKSGRTSWNCKGFPISAMPASCGGRS